MARKIMVLCGSPRPKGNTNTVVEWFVQGASAAGAQVEKVDLAKLKLSANGCTCCLACQKSDRFECVIHDDAGPLLARMPQAQVLVFATPVYFFGPSAQLKLVLDRMYCLFKWQEQPPSAQCAIKHATIVLISTAGDGPDGGLGLVKKTFDALCEYIGCKFECLLVPNAPKDPSTMATNQQLQQEALELGRRVAEG